MGRKLPLQQQQYIVDEPAQPHETEWCAPIFSEDNAVVVWKEMERWDDSGREERKMMVYLADCVT